MIVFINLSQGNPLHALAGLLLCLVVNVVCDFLTSSAGVSGSLWLELAAASLGLVLVGVLLAVALKWLLGPRPRPLTLRQLLTGLFTGQPARAAANARRQQQTAQQRQQRWDKVVRALQCLPTDTVTSEAELQQLSAHELKQRLADAGGSCSGCVEKGELVAALLALGGSSSDSCCICCEEYVAGDVVRVLPCKHRFHIECVDRWFLSSTDYSRPPACPMCNAELELEASAG